MASNPDHGGEESIEVAVVNVVVDVVVTVPSAELSDSLAQRNAPSRSKSRRRNFDDHIFTVMDSLKMSRKHHMNEYSHDGRTLLQKLTVRLR